MFRLFAGYFYFYPFKNNVKRVILYYGFLYTAVPENIKKTDYEEKSCLEILKKQIKICAFWCFFFPQSAEY